MRSVRLHFTSDLSANVLLWLGLAIASSAPSHAGEALGPTELSPERGGFTQALAARCG